MQTRAQKKISPSEEQNTLKVLDEIKKSRRRHAPAADAAPDSDTPRPKKKPGRKRTSPSADAAPDGDAPPPKKHFAKKRRTPVADASRDIDAPPPEKKSPRKRSKAPMEPPPGVDPPSPKQKPGRRRSTPPVEYPQDMGIPSETEQRRFETQAEPPPETSSPSPKQKFGRKRSSLAVYGTPGINTSPPKKQKLRLKPPKAVRFEDEERTPSDQLQEDIDQRLEEDKTTRKPLNDISASFSGGLADELLKELEEDCFAGVDSGDDAAGTTSGEEEWEEGEVPEEGEMQPYNESMPDYKGGENPEKTKSTSLSPTHAKPAKIPLHPADAAIKSYYHSLKKLAWAWTSTHFPRVPSATSSLSLSSLANTHPELMEYANYISSCGSNSWEDVFNEQRGELVYGILGKMIDVHVFGCEMFGASEEEERELAGWDEGLVNDDGFLRQRTRADLISSFHHPLSPKSPTTPFPTNFQNALSTLHASFLAMVSPLLPSPISPDKEKALETELSHILHAAATLSLAVRQSPDVIYYWQTHPAVGSTFSPQEMHKLDKSARQSKTAQRNQDRYDCEIVTMAGWPSCVAYRADFYFDEDDAARDYGYGKSNRSTNNRILKKRKPPLPITISKADVLTSWGQPLLPHQDQAETWLGPRLRVEMKRRLDSEERRNVVVPGVIAGTALASAWVYQSWFGEG